MNSVAAPLRGLYLVTRETADTQLLLRTVGAALDGGAVLVQYRDKSGDENRRLQQTTALIAACAARGVSLIVNDDVALALRVGAAGVHLGEHDDGVAQARTTLGPRRCIGASCYNDLARAHALAAQRPDYLAFGSFFDSSTKPGARRAPIAILGQARALGLPLAAIGGITPDNAQILIDAGADLLAVIGGVFDAPDPGAAARAIARRF
jgi:thiamine-phosphate pyrophosphorylase